MSVIDELSPYIRAYPEAFRMARARRGLTNEELSERSGVPYSTVRNAQSGNGGVTIVQAAALARVLDLSIDEMFGAVKPEAGSVSVQSWSSVSVPLSWNWQSAMVRSAACVTAAAPSVPSWTGAPMRSSPSVRFFPLP